MACKNDPPDAPILKATHKCVYTAIFSVKLALKNKPNKMFKIFDT